MWSLAGNKGTHNLHRISILALQMFPSSTSMIRSCWNQIKCTWSLLKSKSNAQLIFAALLVFEIAFANRESCESRANPRANGQSVAGKVQEVNNIGSGRSQLMCNLPLKCDLHLYSVHCLESLSKFMYFNWPVWINWFWFRFWLRLKICLWREEESKNTAAGQNMHKGQVRKRGAKCEGPIGW